MLIIGLTGSIGMGKSTLAARFRLLGVAVCDADAEVHKLYAGAAVAPVEAAFPGTTEAGTIDRDKLAQTLMRDPTGFKRLEAIVHPLVQAAERDFLRAEFVRGASMAVLEIPLLYEVRSDKKVDVVVLASAPADQQRARVLARPGMTDAKLAQILARQTPDAEKRKKAHFVVDTGRTIPESEAQLDAIVAQLRGRIGTAYMRFWA
jgi:dephospho-CoA kinase